MTPDILRQGDADRTAMRWTAMRRNAAVRVADPASAR